MTFHDLWDSVDKLSRLIVLANWGIAATLLVAFTCTVIAIKASNRKDELTSAEDLRKASQVANLENSNLTLRAQVANLETNASDAKAAQQRVEIELSQQREKTANAERDLLAVRKRQEPRNLLEEEKLRTFLENKAKSPLVITCVQSQEACNFADQIKKVLVASGWSPSGVIPRPTPGNPAGILLHIGSANPNVPVLPDRIPAAALVLRDAFKEVLGIELDLRFPISPMKIPPDTLELFIGYP